MTQSSWLISFKERQEKGDGEDVDKIAESFAVVRGGEEEMEEEIEEELVDLESKLLCSSPPPQLARHLHSKKTI